MATREFQAQFLHKGRTKWIRSFASSFNAYRRGVEILMVDGEPGDVVEIYRTNSGFQVGTIKIKVGGHMDIRWDKDAVLLNWIPKQEQKNIRRVK